MKSAPTGNLRRGNTPPPPPPQFTALNIAYDRLLPIIRDLPDFKWPPPMKAGPDQRNKSLLCDYNTDHGHETNNCQSLKFMVEKHILAGNLRWYLQEPTREATAVPPANKLIAVTPQNRGVSLRTRQLAKYSWMSGNPTPLTKIE